MLLKSDISVSNNITPGMQVPYSKGISKVPNVKHVQKPNSKTKAVSFHTDNITQKKMSYTLRLVASFAILSEAAANAIGFAPLPQNPCADLPVFMY